jgi:hypothetical protein
MKKKTRARRDPNRYPKGWNRRRVQKVLDHYEKQTPEEAAAEDDAAYRNTKLTMMAVPVELVPAVQRLIARRRAG